ncbi:MAG TPA: hypothetical protein VMX55_09900 [candidate division Zixibacteria bacterium]|nr:hypothetical protein [candidate division Zixibacteria bacterium]
MTLIEELRKLETTDNLAIQIRKIVENKGELIYQIIILLTKENMEKGYAKEYTLKELQGKLPWKKSTAILRLQEVEEEGVLTHKKRRYKLNKENVLVKRIWNYYHKTTKQEKEKWKKILQLKQKKNELEKRIVELKEKGKYRKLTKNEEKAFCKEIMQELEVEDPKEDLIKYLLKNKEKVMGYKERVNGGRSRI